MLYGGEKVRLGGSSGPEKVMVERLVGQWMVGVMSFKKIFGLYGLKHHIVENGEKLGCHACGRTTDDGM